MNYGFRSEYDVAGLEIRYPRQDESKPAPKYRGIQIHSHIPMQSGSTSFPPATFSKEHICSIDCLATQFYEIQQQLEKDWGPKNWNVEENGQVTFKEKE